MFIALAPDLIESFSLLKINSFFSLKQKEYVTDFQDVYIIKKQFGVSCYLTTQDEKKIFLEKSFCT